MGSEGDDVDDGSYHELVRTYTHDLEIDAY